MAYTPTRLRAHLYQVLDQVLRTGTPIEVIRKGKSLKIVPAMPARNKLARLEKHPDFIVGDPDDLVHIDWLKHWKPLI